MTILCPTSRVSLPILRVVRIRVVSTLSKTNHFLHAVPSTISNVTKRFVIPRQTPYQVSILAFLATSVGIGHCCLGLFSSRCFNPLLDGSTRDWPVKRIIPGKKFEYDVASSLWNVVLITLTKEKYSFLLFCFFFKMISFQVYDISSLRF